MNDEASSKELSVTNGSDVLTNGLKSRSDLKQRVIAFKISHVLVAIFFAWLLYVDGVSLHKVMSDALQSCSYNRIILLHQRLSSYTTCP